MPKNEEEYTLEWVSGVNKRGEPFIHLAKVQKSGRRELIAQLDPWQTRDCALNALCAAEAAQSDAFLCKFLVEKIGIEATQMAAVLSQFRDYRATIGTSQATPPEHWSSVMDAMAEAKTGKPFDPTKKQ